jgi:hypothetical protein
MAIDTVGGCRDGEGNEMGGPGKGSCRPRSEEQGCRGERKGERGRKRKVSVREADSNVEGEFDSEADAQKAGSSDKKKANKSRVQQPQQEPEPEPEPWSAPVALMYYGSNKVSFVWFQGPAWKLSWCDTVYSGIISISDTSDDLLPCLDLAQNSN